MQVIIPMSGSGQRFKDAGYEMIKPLIEVNGKTFVEYVIDLFSKKDTFIFICDENHLKETKLKEVLLKKVPDATIVAIASHKKGPVYAVQQAIGYINLQEPCIINYCDFTMQWNYIDFVKNVQQSNCHGAIPCYTGFHPHLLHAHNVYAGCAIDEQKKLKSIKEKFSFEIDKTKGHHSVGTYYFKSGAIMQYYITDLIEKNNNLNGEFYASMLYEQMLIDGKYIKVFDAIEHFCQWGTPQDFKEYLQWENIFFQHKNYSNKQHENHLKNTTLLLPMAGDGKRFAEENYKEPKPFIAVDNINMFQRAINDLPICTTKIFITKRDIKTKCFDKEDIVVTINNTTDGQASTCLLAKNYINNTSALLISPCDNGMIYDIKEFIKTTEIADVIVFTFRSNCTVVNKPNQYGWVKVDEFNNALLISCKQKISEQPESDHAVTGAFWFKQGNYFVQASEKMIAENRRINNEFYVDDCINDCIQLKLKVKVFEIEHYICWGTPNDLKTYQYWQHYFNTIH